MRLWEAIQDWARRNSLGDLGAHWGAEIADGLSVGGAGSGFATGSEECRLCPICQVVGALRQHHPDVADHLTDAVTSLSAAARAALGAQDRPREGRGGVQHIDIG